MTRTSTLRLVLALALLSGCGTATSTDCSTLTDTWSTYGQGFFSAHCTTCHEHTSDFATQSSVVNQLDRIEAELSSGDMPEDTTLSATEKSRVLAWLSCGAP